MNANKKLSIQLCEICGIKPKIIQDYELNDIELYPDFENNNNNFVKLFELKLEHSDATLAQIIVSNYLINNKRTFLESVMNYISRLKARKCEIILDAIKNSIEQKKWEI